MERIMIIGNCGAGKTALSRKVHDLTGLPLIHLDQEYWLPGWSEPDKEAWRQKVTRLAARKKWIIDGNYSGTGLIRLQQADTVVFLDRSRWLCLFRAGKRILRNYGRTRPDLAPGCPERFDLAFLQYIYRFPQQQRPGILRLLEKRSPQQQLFHLRTEKEVNDFLQQLVKRIA